MISSGQSFLWFPQGRVFFLNDKYSQSKSQLRPLPVKPPGGGSNTRSTSCCNSLGNSMSDPGKGSTLKKPGSQHCSWVDFGTVDWSHLKKKLASESRWVNWKQIWDFRTFRIHKVEAVRHFGALPTVPATAAGDFYRRSADLVIWLSVINVTEHSSLPSLPTGFAKWLLSSSPCRMETARGYPPWWLGMPHCGMTYLILNFPINSFNQHFFARAGRCRGWCHAVFSSQLSN